MIHGNSLRSGRRIWWVLTAVSDTSDNQTWGFKYVQNLLRIGALDSNMTVIHVQPWLSAAFLGGASGLAVFRGLAKVRDV